MKNEAMYECGRCGGTGRLGFTVANGVCFACKGTGHLSGELTRAQREQEARIAAAAAAEVAARATRDDVDFIGPTVPFAAQIVTYDFAFNEVVAAATVPALRAAVRALLPAHRDYAVTVFYGAAPSAVRNGYADAYEVATWHGDGTGAEAVAEKLRAAVQG